MTMVEQDNDAGLIGQLVAKIGLMVSVGQETRDQTKRVAQKLDAMSSMQPVNFRAQGSCIVDAGGFGVIQFSDSPQQGHVWEIQNIVVGGDTFATAAAGSPEFYSSAMDLRSLKDASPPITDLVDATATSLPTVAFYSRGQFTIRNGEKLWVRIVAGTPGQQYAAVARGLDIQEAANKQVTSI